MTEADLFKTLDAVMPGSVFMMLAPAGTVEPYLVFQRTLQLPSNSMCGYENLDQIHYQIDSYGKSHAQALANTEAAKEALRALDPEPTIENEQDLYEQDTRLHRTMITLITWQQPEKVTA